MQYKNSEQNKNNLEIAWIIFNLHYLVH